MAVRAVVEVRRRGGGPVPRAWMGVAQEAMGRVAGVAAVRDAGPADPPDPRSGRRFEVDVEAEDGRAAARAAAAAAQAVLPGAICLWHLA